MVIQRKMSLRDFINVTQKRNNMKTFKKILAVLILVIAVLGFTTFWIYEFMLDGHTFWQAVGIVFGSYALCGLFMCAIMWAANQLF